MFVDCRAFSSLGIPCHIHYGSLLYSLLYSLLLFCLQVEVTQLRVCSLESVRNPSAELMNLDIKELTQDLVRSGITPTSFSTIALTLIVTTTFSDRYYDIYLTVIVTTTLSAD